MNFLKVIVLSEVKHKKKYCLILISDPWSQIYGARKQNSGGAGVEEGMRRELLITQSFSFVR